MSKITIIFTEDIYQKLNDNAKNKKISTSQYIRNLIDVGLRVEEFSDKNEKGNDQNIMLEKLDEIHNFIKKGIISGCENLYLTRYSVLNLPGKSEEELDRVIEKAKIKSKAYVEGLSDKS